MFFDNPEFAIARLLVFAILWGVFWLGPIGGFLFLIYFCMTLPMRRQERAQLFLDLMESGLKDGRRMEESIQAAASSRDRSLGIRFHTLAYNLAAGYSLSQALDKVPRLLPPQITAMLKAGSRIGDLRKVLPACRQLLSDAQSQTRGAMNYLMLMMAYVILPTGLTVMTLLEIFILPKFVDIARFMEVRMPKHLAFITDHRAAVLLAQLGIAAMIWLLAFLYVGGPRLTGWLEEFCSPLVSRIQYALPWRRKRMQRDFSAILAVLLDAGMPEPEALELAAGCTVNEQFELRAIRAVEELKAGQKLPEAVKAIDDTGEFHWRLTNAAHAHGGFSQALAGWNGSLDAKAFQQEQAAAQLITTGLVLVNGIIVGLVVVGVFQVLIAIIDVGLW